MAHMENGMSTETWKNTAKGRIGTLRKDHLGQISKVYTRGGAILSITPEDREMTQERISDPTLDPFQNGLLTPIALVDADAAERAASNPNILTEDDLEKLLAAPAKEFAARLNAITSEPVIRRLRTKAAESDVKMSRRELISARLEQISPSKVTAPSGPDGIDD